MIQETTDGNKLEHIYKMGVLNVQRCKENLLNKKNKPQKNIKIMCVFYYRNITKWIR